MKINRNSIIWLAAASVAFTLAVLLFTPLRMSLNWDENIYASQISQHAPIMLWSPERARGEALLVAPVTLLTGSAVVLRIYLALLAGAGLFVALLTWRGQRPASVLALAGVLFGGLWIAQAEASLVYPNFWVAIGGLAAVGLFLRAVTMGTPSRFVLCSLAVAVAFTSLMRPVDAIFLFAPLLAVAIALRAWRSWTFLVAISAGLAVGLGEWLIEAYMYFGGPFARLHRANQAVGGTKFNPITSLRILSGGRSSSVAGYPGITGWSRPGLLLWWLAFLMFAALGVYVAARSKGWLLAALPAICALSVYVLYMLPARDNARYLLPAWALLAIPAADGIAWLVTDKTGRTRLAAVTLTAVFLVVELGTQHVILTSQSASKVSAASMDVNAANALRELGVHAPCVITSVHRPYFAPPAEPAAFEVGCTYVWHMTHIGDAHGRQVVVLVLGKGHQLRYALHWRGHMLTGTGNVFAYIQS